MRNFGRCRVHFCPVFFSSNLGLNQNYKGDARIISDWGCRFQLMMELMGEGQRIVIIANRKKQEMEMDLNCPHCSTDFRDNNPPRLLQCGHTFCHSCLQSLVEREEEASTLICPEDQQSIPVPSNLEELPKNIALMKIIEGRKKNSSNNSNSSIRDASFDVSKINKEEECQEDEVAEELISEINRATSGKDDPVFEPIQKGDSLTEDTQLSTGNGVHKSPEKQQVELCLLHQKPIQVVCMKDYERLCSKCALFGEHRTHDFKSVEQIEKENRKYYQEIINVFESKATFVEKNSIHSFEKDLLELLSVKTSKLKKEISDRFKKIYEEVVKAEKNAIKKLEEMNHILEQTLIYSLKPDEKIGCSYDCWQANTLEIIKDSEKSSNEGHLNFYLKRNQILEQGNQLFENLKRSQQSTYNQTVKIIEDFNVVFHESDYSNMFNKLVEVVDRTKEEPKKVERLKENEATLANCDFEEIKRSPQLMRHESEESLLDACDFQTQSFAGDTVGSRILDQSFVSVRGDHVPHPKEHHKEHTARPLIKRKAPVVKQKQKCLIKQAPVSHPVTHTSAKRKIKALKVPEKYEKVVEGVMNDTLETVDLTNAQLGDNIVLHILELMRDSTKVKSLKLIRNKLSDDGIAKMMPYFSHLMSLNLSQNQLTEQTLNLFIENRANLPLLKSLVLSQTKIVERKSKAIIEKLRKMQLGVSV